MRVLLWCVLLSGCLGQDLGGFSLQPTAGHIEVRARGGRLLLTALRAESRVASARWEELYGEFKVTEGSEPWQPLELKLAASSPAEGALLLEVRAPAGSNRIAVDFDCALADRFLGFGEQSDALDHHGHRIPIWTSEPGIGKSGSDEPGELWFLEGTRHGSSLGLPTWLSSRGYIGAVQSSRRLVFDVCKADPGVFRIEAWDSVLRLWVYDGPSPAQALERATAGVLGRQMRPPVVAFAPWNDAIFGSVSVRSQAARLRAAGVPSSVIWSEDYRGGHLVGSDDYQISDEWDVDRTLYPDAEAVASDLHAAGFAWLAYFNSFLMQGTRDYSEALLARRADGTPALFQGPTAVQAGLLDLFQPAPRDFALGKMRGLLALGFDGWMADFGEWLPHDAAGGGDAHQQYAAQWIALQPPDALVFSRSGYMGSQRFVQVHWPGDQRTDFEADDGMPTVIPMALNLGLAGWSTTGADIAGYQSATNPHSTKELFFRWTMLGALQPVMRTHHGRSALANWWWGKDDETLAHWKKWALFHARLFPYLDGLAAQHEQTGLPMMRALALEFPEDEAGWAITDEFMLGPNLLVAPVQQAGAVSRLVHFPPGRWVPFFGGDAVNGPADLVVPAALDELPLYARGVIPLFTAAPMSVPRDLAASDTARTLLVFGDGSFTERDGTHWTAHDGQAAVSGGPARAVTATTR